MFVASDQSVVMTHLTAAGLSVAVIQWIKSSPYLPWITGEQKRLVRLLAVITSAIGAFGISYTWHPEARELILKIPTLAAMLGIFAAWAKSFIAQEIVYRGTVKNSAAVSELIKQLQDRGFLPPGGKILPSAVGAQAQGKPLVGGSARSGLAVEKWKTRYPITRRKLLPAIAVCMAIVVGGIVVLCYGCAVRHLPSGATAPATRFEQILSYNAALAQLNDGFADNVIGLRTSGTITKSAAKTILTEQATIAVAHKKITAQLTAAANCGLAAAGSQATPAQVSDASAVCAKSHAAELQNSINLILGSLATLNNGGLLGVAEQQRFQLARVLASIGNLAQQMLGALREYAVISRAEPFLMWTGDGRGTVNFLLVERTW